MFSFSISTLVTSILFLCFVTEGSANQIDAQEYTFHRDHILGTSFDLKIVVPNKSSAEVAEEAALKEIDRLNTVFSLYDSQSEISRLNEAESLVVSDDLLELIEKCEQWRAVTDNIFSARIGSIVQKWREAERSGVLPDRPSLRIEADDIRRAKVSIDSETNTIEKDSVIVWTTDAIAKGYIIDKAFEAAMSASPDASGLLMNIGGDIRLMGESSKGGPWKIGVPEPQLQIDNSLPKLVVALSQGAIATSGHSARSFEIEGKSYSHIIDTISGWTVEASHSATVLAPTATIADVMATTFTAMNAVESVHLAEKMPGVECLIYGYDGRQYVSSGWRQQEIVSVSDNLQEDGWPNNYELAVEYEVPKLKVSKYRAPYVAVWITGSDRKLIKTLTMLGESPRWTEENYVWWRRYARKEPLLVDAISEPSRKPGRYRLLWDGVDDFGYRVPQGDYILNIEFSREYGGHSLAKIDLPLYGKKYRSHRKAEGEIGFVRVVYAQTKK